MTVAELKKLLVGVPENYEVTVVLYHCVEAVWRDIDGNRIGLKGAIATIVDPPPPDFRDARPFHSWAATGGVVMWKGKNFGEFRLANGSHCPSLGGKNDQPEEEVSSQLQLSAGQGIVKG